MARAEAASELVAERLAPFAREADGSCGQAEPADFEFDERGTPDAASGDVADEYQILAIPTEHGPMEARLFDAGSTKSGAIFVGGNAGTFDSPANGLYARLGLDLSRSGVTCLWVRYRDTQNGGGAFEPLRPAIRALSGRGIARIGLVGHASGGAAVIRAAEIAREVRAIVTLAMQNDRADLVADMNPRPILLVHGTADRAAAPSASVEMYRLAREPKELRLIDGAGHDLDEAPGTVHLLVRAWLERWLSSDVIPIPLVPRTGNAG